MLVHRRADPRRRRTSGLAARPICLYGVAMIVGIAATLVRGANRRGPTSCRRRNGRQNRCGRRAASSTRWSGRSSFSSELWRIRDSDAAAISLTGSPISCMGPMANPLYHDIGLSKDIVAAVRGSVGIDRRSFLGIAAGGFVCRCGSDHARADRRRRLQTIGTRSMPCCLLTWPFDDFHAAMALDNFGIAMAGVTLVAYMSSLTSSAIPPRNMRCSPRPMRGRGKSSKAFRA